MRYCKKCVQPDTRPGIYFNEQGVCGSCLWEEEKKRINWDNRLHEIREICDWAKSRKAAYDCVIGVSGGKDSTFQALYMRDKLGMRPLLVSSEPYRQTELGLRNIENLKKFGFDTITLSADKRFLKKLFRRDFFSIGNPNRPSEYCLHSSVYIIADKFDIPLIVNGENPGQTLGIGDLKNVGGDATKIFTIDTVRQNPIEAYADDAEYDELFMYHVDMKKIQSKNIRAIWLSNYVKEWSQIHNARFSLAHGLSILPPEMNPYSRGFYRRFSSLDHSFHEVNQLLKFIKFGFGFTTDQACYDIRDGEITREEGIFLARELDGRCADSFIDSFCQMIEISKAEFWETANSWRGNMWRRKNGGWELDSPIWEREKLTGNYDVRNIMRRLGI